MSKPLVICWFSCGAASAVATKLIFDSCQGAFEIAVIHMAIDEEHPDNDRFARDCEQWIGCRINKIKSRSAEEVWTRRRYMAGVKGASCTSEIKIAERKEIVKKLQPAFQVFGYTSDEVKRYERFVESNDGPPIEAPLIRNGITKQMSLVAIADAGIHLPEMYRLGFPNNNCIGCVKANGLAYWSRVREQFPDVFDARCKLSRELGCRLLKVKGKRYFLDELGSLGGAERWA